MLYWELPSTRVMGSLNQFLDLQLAALSQFKMLIFLTCNLTQNIIILLPLQGNELSSGRLMIGIFIIELPIIIGLAVTIGLAFDDVRLGNVTLRNEVLCTPGPMFPLNLSLMQRCAKHAA